MVSAKTSLVRVRSKWTLWLERTQKAMAIRKQEKEKRMRLVGDGALVRRGQRDCLLLLLDELVSRRGG